MPRALRTFCKWCGVGVMLGASPTAFVLLAFNVQSLFSNSASIVEKIWTVEDLSSMAGSSTMTAAVSSLTTAAHGSRASALKLDEVKALIDGHTAADIRYAILKVADAKYTNKFAKFARNTNGAATCSTAGTAGEHGLDLCLAGCEKKHSLLAWTPRKGPCYMLCALATSPCTKDVAGTTAIRTVAWGTMYWTEVLKRWKRSALTWMVMNAPTTTLVIYWVVLRLEMMAWEIASWVAIKVETMLSWEGAWTAIKIVFATWVLYEVYIMIRATKIHWCEVEKDQKAAQRKLEELKLDHVIETRKTLLNEEDQHPLHDLGSWVIDRDSVDGGQRSAAQECQLAAGCSGDSSSA